jgi:hypothetical protein
MSQQNDFTEFSRHAQLSFPSRAAGFIGKLAPIVLSAAIFAGVGAVSTQIDKAINPDIVDTLKQNWRWDRFFTSRHGFTVLNDNHPAAVEGTLAALGALWGGLRLKLRECD